MRFAAVDERKFGMVAVAHVVQKTVISNGMCVVLRVRLRLRAPENQATVPESRSASQAVTVTIRDCRYAKQWTDADLEC